jgi:non-specific serine/threonine protein kinase
MELCSDEERRALAVVSVFAGGFRLDAAQRVAGAVLHDVNVAVAIARLVDLSLVEADRSSDRARYRLLESVRAYGLELLGSFGLETAARRAHFEVMYSLVCPTVPHDGNRRTGWADEMAPEHGNLLAALSWSLAGGDVSGGVGLVVGSIPYWDHVGQLAEGRSWAERALAVSDGAAIGVAAQAHLAAGFWAHCLDEDELGLALLERARVLFDADRDKLGVARAFLEIGESALSGADHDRSRAALTEAIARYEALGDLWGWANSEMMLGNLVKGLGDDDEARAHGLRGLEVAERLGNPVVAAEACVHLGQLADGCDDRAERRRRFEQGLVYAEAGDDRRMMAASLTSLALLASDEGDDDLALELSRRALQYANAHGALFTVCRVNADAGLLASRRGDTEAAVAYLTNGVRLAERIRVNRLVVRTVDQAVEALALIGRVVAAREVAAKSRALRESLGIPRSTALAATLRGLLGTEAPSPEEATVAETVARTVDELNRALEPS